ncbi:MAG: nitrous oxide reductase accessory protein NosL [Nitrospirota bacterium]
MKIFRRAAVAAIAAVLIMAGMAVFAADDIDSHRSCHFCGMDRKAYGYSRMLIRYEDGTESGVCSLHCAVQALYEEPTRPVKDLFVADRDDRTLINAETAFWVIGGIKRGVMTQRPKWAFRTQAGAESFVKAYGGTIISWNAALAAAREDAAPAGR